MKLYVVVRLPLSEEEGIQEPVLCWMKPNRRHRDAEQSTLIRYRAVQTQKELIDVYSNIYEYRLLELTKRQ